MSVKDRLKIFISSQKMTVSAFETSILASNGYVNSISRSIGIDKLGLIIEKYPILNIVWLLTGNGEMMKSGSDYPDVSKAGYCQLCAEKDRTISVLTASNEYMKESTEDLKSRIKELEKKFQQSA